MTFKDIKVGQKFEFDHTGLPLASGIARGPWVKLSPRKYIAADLHRAVSPRAHWQHALQVGTIKVSVVPA